ncbi:hypothetical protein E2320_022199 [Naja naja]|nr:hypothetical protein E2320_022199 [Naja naja]
MVVRGASPVATPSSFSSSSTATKGIPIGSSSKGVGLCPPPLHPQGDRRPNRRTMAELASFCKTQPGKDFGLAPFFSRFFWFLFFSFFFFLILQDATLVSLPLCLCLLSSCNRFWDGPLFLIQCSVIFPVSMVVLGGAVSSSPPPGKKPPEEILKEPLGYAAPSLKSLPSFLPYLFLSFSLFLSPSILFLPSLPLFISFSLFLSPSILFLSSLPPSLFLSLSPSFCLLPSFPKSS